MANDGPPRGEDAGDQFAQALKGSARQIWLAGLGALGRAQQEGGRLFEALAQEGARLQGRWPPARAQVERAREGVAGLAEKASERIDALFEQRVGKALDHLDVPLGSEVDALREQLDALAARVDVLERTLAAAGAKPPRRRAARADDAEHSPPPEDPAQP